MDTFKNQKDTERTNAWLKSNGISVNQIYAGKNGMHFDTTPVTENGLEYVDDCELNEYGQANLENLTDCVASSLLLKDEKFYAVNKVDERMLINPVESLNTRTLFRVAAIKS